MTPSTPSDETPQALSETVPPGSSADKRQRFMREKDASRNAIRFPLRLDDSGQFVYEAIDPESGEARLVAQAYGPNAPATFNALAAMVKSANTALSPSPPAAAGEGDVLDNPEADSTDAAHPAWWRGHEHTAKVLAEKVIAICEGRDDGAGVASEPWESARRKVLALAARVLSLTEEREKLASQLESQGNDLHDLRTIHAKFLRRIKVELLGLKNWPEFQGEFLDMVFVQLAAALASTSPAERKGDERDR